MKRYTCGCSRQTENAYASDENLFMATPKVPYWPADDKHPNAVVAALGCLNREAAYCSPPVTIYISYT